MTVFHCEGFETLGDTGTSGADVQDRFDATTSGADGVYTYQITSAYTGDVSLIDDFQSVGLAIEYPLANVNNQEWMRFEFPDGGGRYNDYQVPANASVPEFVSGFRFYNAALTTAREISIWANLHTSGPTACSQLRVDANQTDLIFLSMTGSSTTISGVLSTDTWHYIEIHYKPCQGSNGGFATIYVDGSEVADLTSEDVVSATFYTNYGVQLGIYCLGGGQVGSGRYAFDDVYHLEVDGVTHTGPLGPSRVLLLQPNADGGTTDWTPSTGSDNYAMVDNIDWETTDYVEADATTEIDKYDLETLGAQDEVHGIMAASVVIATDGTPTVLIGADNGTLDEESIGVVGTVDEIQAQMFFDKDPTGSAWNVTTVNSVEVTQKMTE